MSESSRHMRLVSNIVKWLRETQASEDLCVFVDDPTQAATDKPPNIGGYLPDVFAKSVGLIPVTIIGEAKTSHDLETKRSELQFIAYLSFLKKAPEPLLVVSTSWVVQRSAKGFLCRLRDLCDAPQVNLVFLSEMPPVRC